MKLRSNSRRILFNELEGDEYLLKTIPQNSIPYFLDIGANVGLISIMARLLHPKMKIVSVEPHPEVYSNLVDNVEHLKISTLELALGNGEKFYLQKPRKTDLCNSFADGKTNHYEIQSYKLMDIISQAKVDINKLWLKIDVEGAEKYLKGDKEVEQNLNKVQVCVVEVHDKLDNDIGQFINWFMKIFKDSHNINIRKMSKHLTMVQARKVYDTK